LKDAFSWSCEPALCKRGSLKPAEVKGKIVVCDVVERNNDILAKGLVVKHANTSISERLKRTL
jgi:hypothetical protein